MKLRLAYLLAAILVAAIAATVFVQLRIAARQRERQAIEDTMAPVLAKLDLSDEILHTDLETLVSLNVARRFARQMRDASDPGLYKPLYDSTDYWSEVVTGEGPREDATDACTAVADWFSNPASPVGTYLRAHPDLADQRLRPALLRLLDAHNDDEQLRYRACSALFAMGERSTRLADALMKFGSPPEGAEFSNPSLTRTLKTMLQAFGRKPIWETNDVFLPIGPYPAYADPAPRATSQSSPLPPGALYVLHRPEFEPDEAQLPVILDGDGRRLYVLYCKPNMMGILGSKLFVWDLAARKPLPSPLPAGVNMTEVAVNIQQGIIATAEYRPEPGLQTPATKPAYRPTHRVWIHLWDLQGKSLGQLEGPKEDDVVEASGMLLTFSGDGKELIWEGIGQWRWNVQERERYRGNYPPGFYAGHEALSPSGAFVATLSGKSLTVWIPCEHFTDARDIDFRHSADGIRPFRKVFYHPDSDEGETRLEWLDERFLVVSTIQSKSIILFDIDSGKPVGRLSQLDSPVHQFFHVGRTLFTSQMQTGKVYAWDTDAIVRWCVAHSKAPTSMPTTIASQPSPSTQSGLLPSARRPSLAAASEAPATDNNK
jgi:hypothetical protein